MNIREYVPLAPLTTFGVGGRARFFAEVHNEKDIEAAVEYAQARELKVYPLGAGSNILVPDSGIDGLVLKVEIPGIISHEEQDKTVLIVGAGVLWDEVVSYAAERALFGIENLAGIPGTVGGAVVQNIGAYGVELEKIFLYAEVYNLRTRTHHTISHKEALFGYRNSFFKEQRELLILRVALCVSPKGKPHLSYPDLIRARSEGVPLATPKEIVSAVRAIRSKKFPERVEGGTAGSFFKNPILSDTQAMTIAGRFPGMPLFPQKEGLIKIPLAWILDHGLSLRGYTMGHVRLYEKQPLVIVARSGASSNEIDALARFVGERVFDVTQIHIEREVETFSER